MPGSITGSRRSAFEIVHDILSVCDNGGINKTAIMYRSNLSYDQLCRYLALLSEQQLLYKTESGQFRNTTAGHKTLRQVSSVIRTLGRLQKDTELSAQQSV